MKKILCWSDSSLTKTGFGVVSHHVLSAFHNAGYDINHLAINASMDFSQQKIPWQEKPAKLYDPKDPHGTKMFLNALSTGVYDYVWVMNDIFVTAPIAETARTIINSLKKKPILIYYYPVDCRVPVEQTGFIELVDIPVCYTNHGRNETLKSVPHIDKKLKQIGHGCDVENYFPIPENNERLQEKLKMFRQKTFNINEDTFLIINDNRNSTRKQLAYTILAFSEFRKQVPNSVLYLHTMPRDQGGDLYVILDQLGLNTKKDVLFPANYTPTNPVPDKIMNMIYNSADLYMSQSLGEGWGLSVSTAITCGIPTLVGDNTCMRQLVGSNEERGYLYECKDYAFIDNSGVRPKGLIPDIVNKMVQIKSETKNGYSKRNACRQWAIDNSWKLIGQKWTELLNTHTKVESGLSGVIL